MAPILDSATKYLAYIFFVLMLILDLIILHMDSKTAILGQLVHISWLFLLFSDKMAAILDLAIKYLTYSCFVVFVLILELINLYLDTKTTILCQLVIISWQFFQFSNKMAAILDFARLASLDGKNNYLNIVLFIVISYKER